MTRSEIPPALGGQPVNPAEMSYEEAYAELEQILNDLESNEHSLESAIALFERGQLLAQRCSELLDKSELRVQQILGNKLSDIDF